jgi:cytoskeletal protein CcmA (bactofilin family)
MWKTSQSIVDAPAPVPVLEPASTSASDSAAEAVGWPRALPAPAHGAVVGKSLLIKGEITGSESLIIDGRVEGSVNIPNQRVTIGQNGQVVASMNSNMNVCVTAREIVIMGNVTGDISASDRVDIRTEGTLTGDVITSRISIADGAVFIGGVDIRKAEAKSLSISAPLELVRTA